MKVKCKESWIDYIYIYFDNIYKYKYVFYFLMYEIIDEEKKKLLFLIRIESSFLRKVVIIKEVFIIMNLVGFVILISIYCNIRYG